MKYPIIYTNKYIKKKLVGGLIPEDLKGINFFNKTSNAHEMLDPTNGFFFLKSDALLNYFRFGDDEYPITKITKNKLIFQELDDGIRPSNNFINKNTGITIEEIGKFLGIQYHNLYIKKLLEEYYEVELYNLKTISDEIVKKLKGENNDKFEEINQSEKINFDFNNFITDYNEIILKYKKIFINNEKRQLTELKREINKVKNYLKINYINDKLKNLNLQGIFDRYFDEAKTYYQNNKNYFNLVKNNIKESLNINKEINIDKDNEEVKEVTKEKINDRESNLKEENDEDFNNFMNQFTLELFSLFLSIFWFKAEGKEDVYKYYDGVNSIFEQSRVILQNESDFPIIEVNQVTSSIPQNEQFQNELISKFIKFNSKINLENFTESKYGDQSFPDCGETTLRNFVKIIFMNIENEIDFNLLKRYGASDNLIKYFEIYKDALNNRSIIKPFSLDINNFDLSDKMLDGIILNTEEQQYLKNILDNSNTQDLFNKYQNNVEARPGSSVKTYYIFNNIDEFNEYLRTLIVNINIRDNDNNYKYNSTDAWNLLVSNLEGIKYNPERKTCEIKSGLNDDGKINILEVLKKLFSKKEFDSFKHFEIEGSISIDDSNLKDGFGEVKIKKNFGNLENIYNLILSNSHFLIQYQTTDESNDYFSFKDCYSSTKNKKECFYLKFIAPYETNLFDNLEDILEIFNYNKFFYLYRKFTNNESISRTIQIKNLKNLIITKEKKNIYVNYFKYLISLPNNNDLLKRMIFDCDYIEYFDELFKVDKNGEMVIAPQLINFNNFNLRGRVNKLIMNKIHKKKYNQIDKISFPTSNLEFDVNFSREDIPDDQDSINLNDIDFRNIKILKINGYSEILRDIYNNNNFWINNLTEITEFYLVNFYGRKMPKLPKSIENLQIDLKYNMDNFKWAELNNISTLNNLKELNLIIITGSVAINKEELSDLLKQKIESYLNSNNIVKCKFIFKTYSYFRDEFTKYFYYYPMIYKELITKLSNFNNIDQNEKNELIKSLKNVETIDNYITILLNNFGNIDDESKIKLMSYIK